MAGVGEAAGKFGACRHGATGELVDGAAVGALEVMMVGFAGDLVAGGLAGDVDGSEPGVFDEAGDVAIDGCNADGFDLLLRKGERFFGGEWAVGVEKGRADGVFLAGVAGLGDRGHEFYLSVP